VAGVVVDGAGAPVAGVSVTATLVTKPRLPAAPTVGRYALRSPDHLRATSDAAGRFSLAWDGPEAATVEAVEGPGSKAIAPATLPGTTLTLRLAPTGALRGKVVAPATVGATDLRGIDVFLPGTGYRAKTDAEGAFLLDGLPAGQLTLAAAKAGLGEAEVEVEVRSGGTTEPPPVRLNADAPRLLAVEPASGGPGTRLTITGAGFGAGRGLPWGITIGGVAGRDPERLGNDRLQVTVPEQGGPEGIVVTVGGLPSAPLPFGLIRRLAIEPATLDLLPGERFRLDLGAFDAADTPVASPTWRLEGGTAAVRVAPDGGVEGLTPGEAALRLTSGDAVATAIVRVVADAAEQRGDARLAAGTRLAVLGGTAWVTLAAGVLAVAPGRPARLIAGTDGRHTVGADLGGTTLIAPDGAEHLLVVGGNRLWRLSTTSGAATVLAGAEGRVGFEDGQGPAATFSDIVGLARTGERSWAVLDQNYDAHRGHLRVVSTDGDVRTWQGRLPAGIEGPIAHHLSHAAAWPGGRVAMPEWRQVLLVAPDGEQAEAWPVPALTFRPSVWKGGPDGAVYLTTEDDARTLLRLDAAGGLQTVALPARAFAGIRDLAFDEAGALWVLDAERHKVVRVGPVGTMR
jgi:hypothetical protein